MDYYYKWATYRRKFIDLIQDKYKHLYKGIVLDIGGRDRGKFIKPKNKVVKWIFADINKEFNPEIILDVNNMEQIDSNSIDVVNAIELFEHVRNIENGLKECYRVLKKDGIIIISMPFLYHIHSDPYDFQRWTEFKWKLELKKIGFKLEKLIIMGKYFTHLAEMIKFLIKPNDSKHSKIKRFLGLFLPILNIMIKFDNKSFVKNHSILDNYHNGYFIIARK